MDAPKIRFDFEKKPSKRWVTQEWLHWLRSLGEDATAARLKAIDGEWDLTNTGNAEIAAAWLLLAIRAGYEPAMARLEQFLVEVGRRKFVKPLYEALVKTPEGRKRAGRIYVKARAGYHPITRMTVDSILPGK